MTAKDWILLIVPIVFNGIIVIIIQIFFEARKIKKDIKMLYYMEFSKIIKSFNKDFINENIEIYNGKDALKSVDIFKEYIIEIIKYFDGNKLYLLVVENEVEKLTNSWYEFQNIFKRVPKPISMEDSALLVEKLNLMKLNLEALIYKLDNEMLKI